MSDIWYVAHDGQQEGPMSASEVVSRIESGVLDERSHVFRQGMDEWVPITSQGEFVSAFGERSAPPPPPRRSAAADEIDYEILGHEMQLVEITLDPDEACIAEAGAFLYMDPGIEMQTIFGDGSAKEADGGLVGKLLTAGKRVLTGESLFLTVFGNTATERQKVAF
ncbi:MAG: AIM24 family protein, partial [Thermoanaerobaculia bacterium]|nr:AIM24 family protein [Thermoanaerobaculia bacterium]